MLWLDPSDWLAAWSWIHQIDSGTRSDSDGLPALEFACWSDPPPRVRGWDPDGLRDNWM